jgi:hypothetical protein
LNDKIAKLESELASAQAANDERKIKEISAALETQKSWLTVLG